ncbi:hypothetical protein V2J09_021039 [Rumex salicifolius]
MEVVVRKYQQKFKQAREQMDHWDKLQDRLLSQFRNTSSIIERLEMIHDRKNYGSLRSVGGIEAAVLRKQMDSLEMIMLSINKTMEEFCGVVMWLDKMVKDGRQIVRGGSHQPSVKQLQQRVGVKPSLTDCLDGLILLHEMHHSEYLLKMSIVAALPRVATEYRAGDLSALQKLLVDQPCIRRENVELIYDIIFAEEIC